MPKLALKTQDIIALTLLLIIGLYVWSLPVQDNPLPFGEGDAAHQYGKADFISQFDRVGFDNPYFFYATWYGEGVHPGDGSAPIYPPLYFVDLAIAQSTGFDRFIPVNLLLILLSSTLGVFSLYFLMRKLYGFWPAALTGLLMIFSFRDFMSYVFGQRAILASFALIPFIIYLYYQYSKDVLEGRERPAYAYLLAALLAFAGLIHTQGAFVAVIVLSLYTAYLWIKYRRMPFSIKTVLFSLLMFGVIFAPFAGDLFSQNQASPGSFKIQRLGSLLHWYEHPTPPQPAFLFEYPSVHGGWWTLPFLLLGILFLILKRRDKDMLMFLWLTGLYLALHLDVFGFYGARNDRFLKGEAYIFYPLIVLGFLSLRQYIKIPKQWKQWVTLGLAGIFIVMVIMFNAPPVVDSATGAYADVGRITPTQLRAAEWIDESLPPEAMIYHIPSRDDLPGQYRGWTYQKWRWMQMLSHRAMQDDLDEFDQSLFTHLIVDSSDFVAMGQPDVVKELDRIADERFPDKTLLVDQGTIKVYALG